MPQNLKAQPRAAAVHKDFLLICVYPVDLRQFSAESAAKKVSLFRRRDSASAFVAGDDAILDVDDAISVLGDVGFMGDQR